MPSNSHFSLSLVDAVSGEELREYKADDTSTWVKGDPGEEFFIVVGCHMPPKSIVCALEVDGKDIGYNWICHRANTSMQLGPIKSGQEVGSCTADIVTHAFRFVEVDANGGGEAGDGNEEGPPGHGTIVATWYNAEQVHTQTPPSSCSFNAWEGDAEGSLLTTDNKKDCSVLRSTSGSMPGSLPVVSDSVYEKRDKIGSLEIKYTTDFGIAVRGLYPRQPVQYARPKKRRFQDEDEDEDEDVTEVHGPMKNESDTVAKPEYKIVRIDGREVIELED